MCCFFGLAGTKRNQRWVGNADVHREYTFYHFLYEHKQSLRLGAPSCSSFKVTELLLSQNLSR